MNTKGYLLAAGLILSLTTAKAQQIDGISVNAGNEKIVVVMDGQPMCEATSSCFIAHLVPGTYRIQVFRADEMDLHIASRKLLYYDKIKYNGKGIHHIQLVNSDEDGADFTEPFCPGMMTEEVFDAFCQKIKDTPFDSDKESLLDLLPRSTRFSSRQCLRIVQLLTYDSSRLEALKKLYPKVVDKEAFFIATDALTYSSSKHDMTEFIKKYNRREGRR